MIDELLRVQKLLAKAEINPEFRLQPFLLKIMETIEEKGFIADRDYSQIVDRVKATRTLDFQRLLLLGFIERKGKGRVTYYTKVRPQQLYRYHPLLHNGVIASLFLVRKPARKEDGAVRR